MAGRDDLGAIVGGEGGSARERQGHKHAQAEKSLHGQSSLFSIGMEQRQGRGWRQPLRRLYRPFICALILIHVRLRDLSGLNQRLHASGRQARPRFLHAKVEGRGLQPVIAAEFLVVVGAIVLHALGDGPGLRQGGRRAEHMKQTTKTKAMGSLER